MARSFILALSKLGGIEIETPWGTDLNRYGNSHILSVILPSSEVVTVKREPITAADPDFGRIAMMVAEGFISPHWEEKGIIVEDDANLIVAALRFRYDHRRKRMVVEEGAVECPLPVFIAATDDVPARLERWTVETNLDVVRYRVSLHDTSDDEEIAFSALASKGKEVFSEHEFRNIFSLLQQAEEQRAAK